MIRSQLDPAGKSEACEITALDLEDGNTDLQKVLQSRRKTEVMSTAVLSSR
jgi:hypothetical protein